MQFIGGFTPKQAVRTATHLFRQNITPIIDYAKEANTTPNDVRSYKNVLLQLMKCWDPSTPAPAFAFKYSSFAPSTTPQDDIIHIISESHQRLGSCLFMFDAEHPCVKQQEDHLYEQVIADIERIPALKNVVLMKTIQAYRKDSWQDLNAILDWRIPHMGVKLVRGAYHDPTNSCFYQNKCDTDRNYDQSIQLLCQQSSVPVCFATHNIRSVRLAEKLIESHHRRNISFAQLLGMSDTLTNRLRDQGHSVFKYVPFGTIPEMFPYLVRRLYENYPIMVHALT